MILETKLNFLEKIAQITETDDHYRRISKHCNWYKNKTYFFLVVYMLENMISYLFKN